MGKLEEMGLLVSERRGVKEYYLTPEFRQALDAILGEPHARPVDFNAVGHDPARPAEPPAAGAPDDHGPPEPFTA